MIKQKTPKCFWCGSLKDPTAHSDMVIKLCSKCWDKARYCTTCKTICNNWKDIVSISTSLSGRTTEQECKNCVEKKKEVL